MVKFSSIFILNCIFSLNLSFRQSVPYYLKEDSFVGYRSHEIFTLSIKFNIDKQRAKANIKLTVIEEQLENLRTSLLINNNKLNNKQEQLKTKIKKMESVIGNIKTNLDFIESGSNRHKSVKLIREENTCEATINILTESDFNFMKNFLILILDITDYKHIITSNKTSTDTKEKYLLICSLFDNLIQTGQDIERKTNKIFLTLQIMTSYNDLKFSDLFDLISDKSCFTNKQLSLKVKECIRKSLTLNCYFESLVYTEPILISKYSSTFQGTDACYCHETFLIDHEFNLLTRDKENDKLYYIDQHNKCFESILERNFKKIKNNCDLRKNFSPPNYRKLINGYVIYNNSTQILTDSKFENFKAPTVMVGDFNFSINNINIINNIGIKARQHKFEVNETILCPLDRTELLTNYITENVLEPYLNDILIIGGGSLGLLLLIIFRQKLKSHFISVVTKLMCHNFNQNIQEEIRTDDNVARSILMGYRA